MSKKQTRRTARQAFPKAPPKAGGTVRTRSSAGLSAKGSGSIGKRARIEAARRQTLRPPSIKRAAIQGVILAVLYLVVIRYVWRDQSTGTVSYVVFPIGAFFIYTGIAYMIDKYLYQRRLRKLKGSPR